MKWIFSKANIVEEHDFHKSLERFYRNGISGFIRENIQNSLDARLDENKPVEVTIGLGKMSRKDVPYFDELLPRIKSLIGRNEYSKSTVDHMKEKSKLEVIDYISIEDNNTKGLMGAKKVYNPDSANSYTAYAYARGFHYGENHEDKTVRGGSHGIGKIASNAASDLNIMFFANCDEYGYQTLGGNIQLIDHYFENSAYRSTGYFTDLQDNQFIAVENDGFSSVFNKDTRGLKIVVPFLRTEYKNDGEIIRSVIDGFLLALMNRDLNVIFKDKIIDRDHLDLFLYDDGFYDQDFDVMMRQNDVFTPAYYDTIKHHLYDEKFIIKDRSTDYEFKLFFNYDERMPRGRTGIFRNIGMKIDDFKVNSKVTANYNAVLIPENKKGDLFLKSLENESHTKLDYTHIKADIDKANARYFINQLHSRIAEIYDDYVSKQIEDSSAFSTDDVLYEIRNKFESDLKKGITTVHVDKGKKKVVRKVTPTDEPGENGKKRNGKGRKQNFLPVKRKFGSDETKTYYYLPTGSIRRTQTKTKEILVINLNGIEKLRESQRVNLNVSMVDGMGKEHFNGFDFREVFTSVYHTMTGETISFESNRFVSIPVVNNSIQLDCRLNKKLNNLKLKFYLEV